MRSIATDEADAKFNWAKLSGASGGVPGAQTQLSRFSHSKLVGKLLARATAATERAPVPTSAGTPAHRNSLSKTAFLPPHHIQLLYPWLGITFPRRRHESSFCHFKVSFFVFDPAETSAQLSQTKRASEQPLATDRRELPTYPPTCPILTQTSGPAPRPQTASGHKRHCPYSRDLHLARHLQNPTLNTLPYRDQPTLHSPLAKDELPAWIQTWRTLGACPPS